MPVPRAGHVDAGRADRDPRNEPVRRPDPAGHSRRDAARTDRSLGRPQPGLPQCGHRRRLGRAHGHRPGARVLDRLLAGDGGAPGTRRAGTDRRPQSGRTRRDQSAQPRLARGAQHARLRTDAAGAGHQPRPRLGDERLSPAVARAVGEVRAGGPAGHRDGPVRRGTELAPGRHRACPLRAGARVPLVPVPPRRLREGGRIAPGSRHRWPDGHRGRPRPPAVALVPCGHAPDRGHARLHRSTCPRRFRGRE